MMKALSALLTVALFVFLVAGPALAEDEVLFGKDVENGGYGGPVIKVSKIKGETAILMGGYGGWLINHSFLVGGGFFGLTNEIEAPIAGEKYYYDLGYTGLVLEYINSSHKLVHYSVGTLIGAGEVEYDSKISKIDYDRDSIFVLEPWINWELNISSSFRLGFGVSYRYVDGVRLEGTSEEDLSGATANLTLKFGAF
jgi:hypothetical protein